MLLGRKRHKLLMPELELFLCGESRHIVDDGRFFLCDLVDSAHEPDDFPSVAPCLRVVSAEQTPHMDQSLLPISFLSNVAKIAQLLQFVIVSV